MNIITNAHNNSMFWNGLLEWWSISGRLFPWRETKNPFYILLAEVLLQKTAVPPVVNVYQETISTYPTVAR